MGIGKLLAMSCDKLLRGKFKSHAQAFHVIRRQPHDIKITTARKRTVSAQTGWSIVCAKFDFR